MSRVLHAVPVWLPHTQGFVAELVARSTYPGVVVSREAPLADAPRLRRTVSLAAARGDRAAAAALAAAAAATRAGLVHVHFGYRLRDARLVLGRRPVVLSLHGHDVTAFVRAWPTYYRGVLDRCDAVVVPSAFLAERAVAAGALAHRVQVVPSGVDTEFFTPVPLPDGPPTVVFVGRFVPKKGVDVLLAAWPRVTDAVPTARLRLLGTGDVDAALVRAAGPGVTVTDAPGRGTVRGALRAAQVVCTPSRTGPDGDAESLLLVNVEAQATGRAVVTTRHGGVPEHVREGETALLVPEGDPDALADALVTVLRDRALAERLGAAGPAHAAGYDWRRVARRWDEEVYAPLLRG